MIITVIQRYAHNKKRMSKLHEIAVFKEQLNTDLTLKKYKNCVGHTGITQVTENKTTTKLGKPYKNIYIACYVI